MNELYLCSVDRAIYHNNSSLAGVISQCPINQRCFARLSRSVYNQIFPNDFAINSVGISVSKFDHPLPSILNLAKGMNNFIDGIPEDFLLFPLDEGDGGSLFFGLFSVSASAPTPAPASFSSGSVS